MSARSARTAVAGSVAAMLVALAASVAFAVPSGGATRSRPAADDGADRIVPRFVSSEASKRAALRDVRRRVAELPLPPGAERVRRHSRLTAPRLRGRYPLYGLLFSGREVGGVTFLSFPGGTRSAIRWFLEHRPAGTVRVFRHAGPTGANERYRCLAFTLTEGHPAFGERGLTVCAARARGRASVRVDALSVWLQGRSPYERIPRGSRFIEVVVSQGPDVRRASVLSKSARIDHIVELVNSLPLAGPDSSSCRELDDPSPSAPTVEVFFRSTREGLPIAQLTGEPASEGSCPPLLFYLRGRQEPPLDEGGVVFQALRGTIEGLRRALASR